jgi:sec-independent protein translocase protein TatC
VARIRSVRHEDRLTLVEHLDELRTRILICGAAFLTAFSVCFWQRGVLFDVLNKPLPNGIEPVTFGVTEPFMTTVTVCAYAGLVLALPVILYQLYAFVLPAFSAAERRVALPLMLMAPLLFAGGVAFGYFIVLERTIDFLLHFNESQFNIQVRAREYYSFVTFTLLAMGLIFQVPMAILAVTRVGLVTPAQLRQWRGYAYVLIAVVAALLPTIDPVSMLIEMVPLVILFELSIVLASLFGRSRARQPTASPSPERSG